MLIPLNKHLLTKQGNSPRTKAIYSCTRWSAMTDTYSQAT